MMKGEEMFAGFTVAAGADRFGDRVELHGAPVDCKLSAKDTGGAVCAFEVTVGWPRHRHRDQDEWLYVVEGELACEVGGRGFRVGCGESVFIPRSVPHTWGPAGGRPARVVNVYQPAGDMEAFFRAVGSAKDLPTREQVLANSYAEGQIDSLIRLFDAHGMDLLPPLADWPARELLPPATE